MSTAHDKGILRCGRLGFTGELATIGGLIRMIEYRYLQPGDAEAAAEIHIEGQPGTVLTLLGRRFLTELYRAVTWSTWGEGIGAFDDGRLVAQTAMAVSSEKFFEALGTVVGLKCLSVVFYQIRHIKQ